MRKTIQGFIFGAAMTMILGSTVFAGEWEFHADPYDGDWWSYTLDNGRVAEGWFQDNGNWYYADEDEYNQCYGMICTDVVLPDGYYVDASGKWIPFTERSTNEIAGVWKADLSSGTAIEILTIYGDGTGIRRYQSDYSAIEEPMDLHWINDNYIAYHASETGWFSRPLLWKDNILYIKDIYGNYLPFEKK